MNMSIIHLDPNYRVKESTFQQINFSPILENLRWHDNYEFTCLIFRF